MLDKSQIKELLGTGLSNEIVSTAVGCDPAYITQLMSDEKFKAEVIELRTRALTANSERDRKVDKIEDDLLAKLKGSLDFIFKPTDILRAYAVVNAAKRRGVPAHESIVVNNTVVNLSLPKIVQQKFVMSGNGEVLEVEGQTLVTMDAATLVKGLSDGKDGDRYKKIAGYIEASKGAIEHGISD